MRQLRLYPVSMGELRVIAGLSGLGGFILGLTPLVLLGGSVLNDVKFYAVLAWLLILVGVCVWHVGWGFWRIVNETDFIPNNSGETAAKESSA